MDINLTFTNLNSAPGACVRVGVTKLNGGGLENNPSYHFAFTVNRATLPLPANSGPAPNPKVKMP